MKINTVIIDADLRVQQELCDRLRIYGIFDIVATFDNIPAASDFLVSSDVDAVFINLHDEQQSGHGDGAYLAFSLSENCPDMIVVLYDTVDHSASFIGRINCADFFSLPFDPVIMKRVVNRVKYRHELLQFKRNSLNRSMMVKTTHGYQLVNLDDILFIERYNRKNRMLTVDGREILLNGYTLDELAHILSNDGFYRCYQSYIVNLAQVSSIRVDSVSKNYTLKFESYAGEILLSRDKYSEIVNLLKDKYARITL